MNNRDTMEIKRLLKDSPCKAEYGFVVCSRAPTDADYIACIECTIGWVFELLREEMFDLADYSYEQSQLDQWYQAGDLDSPDIQRCKRIVEKRKKELRYLSERYTELTGLTKVLFRDDGGIELFKTPRKR